MTKQREAQPSCTDNVVQNTLDFLSNKDHVHSMLIQTGAAGSAVDWDLHLQQVAPLGVRLVRLSSSDMVQLVDVAHTLQQYPRVKFAVICTPLLCSEGSGAHAALQSVLTGMTE